MSKPKTPNILREIWTDEELANVFVGSVFLTV